MTFAANVGLHEIVILLWAWQVLRFLLVHFLRVGADAEACCRATTDSTLSLILLSRGDLAIITAWNWLVLLLAVVEVCGELNTLIHRLFELILRDSTAIVRTDTSLRREPSIATNAAARHELVVRVLGI